ncbi:MAG: aminotransferase class V-fold PLP-dependent enzyme [Gammaproteobacteria bacterium]|nr:aminotransferase class V-fold PLP-dependent enzyme [Gammaproteobacteria bacterium]
MHQGLTEDEIKAMTLASEKAISYRQNISRRSVTAKISIDEAVKRFRNPLPDQGMNGHEVIADMIREADDGLTQMSSGNYYGYVLGGSHPIGVAADMMVSAWGQNAGSALETPAISGLERAVCDWVIDLLDLPKESGAGIVTGATVANAEGILAARHQLLKQQQWDVEQDGLFGAPEIPVFIGDAAHSAPFAALRYAGFGAGRLQRLKVDQEGRIEVQPFLRILEKCEAPPLVILQAGQINSGAFDYFAQIIPAVHALGGWVHIDGAFGLWLAAVPELATRLEGVHEADSWAIDLHKWLNAPYDAGLAIVRNRSALVASMSARGAYLPDTSSQWEPSDSTIELSRRARGVPSYAIMRHLGRSGVRELIARHCRLAKQIAGELAAEPGLHVLNEVVANQVALTCGEGEERNSLTNRVLDEVQKRGIVYPSHGEWHGHMIIRISVICYATTDQHAQTLVDEIIQAWRLVQKHCC